MSTRSTTTIAERRTDFTRGVILEAALDLLEREGARELTMRSVAKQAGMSERSVFRYFATRDDLIDAVAEAARDQIGSPPPPRSIAEIRAMPRVLYAAFEARQGLVRAGLRSELFDRMRENAARTRWTAVRHLLDEHASSATPQQRKLHGANICSYLGASSWSFLRFSFKFSFDEAVAAADTAIELALGALRIERS